MNPMVETAVKVVAWLAVVLFASPLIEGVMRKLRAIVHSRQGPPIVQPYFDLAKLLVKEDLSSGPGAVTRLAPPAAFAATLAAAFFVPVGAAAPAAGAGDLFLFVYLISLSSACVMAGGLAQASPFSHFGSSREMMMVVTVEAVMTVALIVAALTGGTALPSGLAGLPLRVSVVLAVVCYLFAMQALVGKLPFDIPEAEQEIMEGPFIEYSGPSLALLKWTFYMKQLLFGSLFVGVFFGWPRFGLAGLPGVVVGMVLTYAAVLGLGLVVALVDATNPRLRIDQSLRFFGGLMLVALAAAGLAAFGF